MKKSTERRLVDYAWMYKRTILIGLLCLTFAVALELTGPFIAKRMIDEHILGIEATWVQVEGAESRYAVDFRGETYVREDRMDASMERVGEASIVQTGRTYYFTDETVPFEGQKSYEDGVLAIDTGDEIVEAEATPLGLNELYSFFAPETRSIVWLLGLYFVLLLFSAVFQYAETFLLQKSSNRIIQRMRSDVFNKIQKLPVSYFNDRPAGKIVARVTNDTEAIRELYVKVLATFFTSAIYMAGIYVALFLLDPRLASFCLLLIPILFIWMKVYKKMAGSYNETIRSTNSDLNGNINEAVHGMSIIQAFRKEDQTTEEFEELNTKHFTYQRKLLNLNSLTSFNLVNLLRNVTFVGFIWYYGGSSIGVGSIVSIGLLYAFVDYLNRLFQPVTDVVNQLAQLEQARVAATRVFELMDEQAEEDDHSSIPRYKGDIVFNHVSFAYEEDHYVLKDIHFHAKEGQTVAFVGHTGSGKSSIMNLLFRFYDPQLGEILIDGQRTVDLSRQQVRSHMGIVLQDPFLFTGTILSNVTMNDPRISREQGIAALKKVGADRFIEKLPKGYDEPVKEKGSTLSAGERQLLSFARALAFDPAILILDEATANIDTETEKLIQDALQVLKEGRTTLVIAHRLSTIQQADQILVLDHGVLKETGTHEELIKEEGIYHSMYKMQQGKLEEAAIS
ncbi:multidrug ABC transporter permease [Pontibacillus halophilus JSM 076056 = DSM 19796]|uniref:Multidrug ABC transporter permease n=1 Tax=Pontibacillus halophilus JSM 076056 = DSM 19796 TaxID=1385510 RepID=A0A0A5GHL5_9BACI|nr:ABC transporter ATP-binding protein [Pontibacillus halophilus]KGX90718.1 multidrug ABC transporter permease [Pontibacillus halophilus JSM 076056 = DSM 19796]